MGGWLIRAVLVLLALAVLGLGVMASGIIPISASGGHWAITRWLLHTGMRRSVATHSLGISAPPLDEERLVLLGAGHYETGCSPCHGAPGAGEHPIPLAMTPHPPPLQGHLDGYGDAELFYIVFHGVKFTGMPAWPSSEREDEAWAMVAFLRRYSNLDEQGYRSLVFGDTLEFEREDVPDVVLDRCARCHGVDGLGRGEGAFPRLAGQHRRYMKLSLEAYARGERHSGVMQPIAARLRPEDIETVVDWYASRPAASEDLAERAAGEPRAANAAVEAEIPLCEHCHGPSAGPQRLAFPKLAGQYKEYLEQQMILFIEGRRGGTKYAELMETVSEHWIERDDIARLAEYFASSPAAGAGEEPPPSP